MSDVDGVRGGKSPRWDDDFYDKPLPNQAQKTAANIANAPWLVQPSGRAEPAADPAVMRAIFSNPAMYGPGVALAKPPPAAPPRPAPLADAPNARHGITLANVAQNVATGTRTDPTRAFTCGAGYKLYPELSRQADGSDAIVQWKAFNTETKRVEFLVGPDALKTFTSSPRDYAVAAANGFMGEQDAATVESARVVDVAMREGFTAALGQLMTAQRAAWTDPAWVAKTTVNVVSSVGPAAAARAELRLEARAAAAEAQVASPNATRFVTHVNEDLPLGKLDGTRTMNCANCAIATDASIAGSPASALPGNATLARDLSAYYGKPWSGAMTSSAEMETVMKDAGAGSRGIVFGRNPNAEIGHFFNVVNEDGVVRFLDGQTGEAAKLGRFDTFWLVRTN